MHELAIMQSVVRVCEREAAQRGFRRVESIALAVGALSGFEPECMFEFFPAAAAGSVAEGAKLVTRVIPAAIECPDCGYSGQAPGRGSAPAAAAGASDSRRAGSFTLIR